MHLKYAVDDNEAEVSRNDSQRTQLSAADWKIVTVKIVFSSKMINCMSGAIKFLEK